MRETDTIQVALFDFCETLVDFQTADAYVDYVRNNTTGWQKRKMTILECAYKLFKTSRLINILNKLTGDKYNIGKRIKLFQLRNLGYQRLDFLALEYYKHRIKPHFITSITQQLQNHKDDGLMIIIVSGGYDIYLKYFAKEFGIDGVLSTRIKFVNDKCAGLFWGADCLNNTKIKLLQKYYSHDNYEFKYAYSDSMTDLPLLQFAENCFVVSHHKGQKWVGKYKNIKEIIW